MTEQIVRVELKDRPYDIVIGKGLLRDAGRRLSPVLKGKKICVVTDTNVSRSATVASSTEQVYVRADQLGRPSN